MGFPRCPSGGVSINVWSGACATVILVVSDLIGVVLGMVREGSGSRSGKKVPMSMGSGRSTGNLTGVGREGKKEL